MVDQLIRLAIKPKQHPWHMARDEGKHANTQRDAHRRKIKFNNHVQHTLVTAALRHGIVVKLKPWTPRL
eukprot:1140166-Pelagomonas_calceolata.AAC.5